MPLRAIFRRALSRGDMAVNPTRGLELPAVRGKRDRIVSPEEAEALLAALPERDRALWATALYGRAAAASCRPSAGTTSTSRTASSASSGGRPGGPDRTEVPRRRRKVPIPAIRRDYLVEHRHGRPGALGHVFGRADGRRFDGPTVDARAKTAWRRAGLEPITLHEARHTFASLMIAAGVNAKALATYMGHARVTITLDRYGPLDAWHEGEAAALARSNSQE